MTVDLFFGTRGNRSGTIMVVGEAFGQEEANQQRPFAGESGRELDKMLAEAGIDTDQCFFTNLIADRPPGNDLYRWFSRTDDAKKAKEKSFNGLYPQPRVLAGLENLYRQVDTIKPQLIIGCGNYPFWAFSSNVRVANSTDPSGWKVPGGISTWRGSQLVADRGPHRTAFLPILHPASVVRNWSIRPITVHDLRVRTPLALDGLWERPNSRVYIIPPTFKETLQFLSRLHVKLERGPVEIVADLETKGKRVITCIGLLQDGVTAISIPFLKVTGHITEPVRYAAGKILGEVPDKNSVQSYWSFNEEKAIVRHLRTCLNHPNARLVGQNFLYDSQYMARWWKIVPRVSFDTMVAQHVMFPGTPKALWYLASLYCRDFYSFWKEDSKEWEEDGEELETHLRYNCDDLFYTWRVWQAQKDALVRMGMTEQFDFKMQEWQLAFEMMDKGVRIDKNVRNEMSLQVVSAAQTRQEWLEKVVPVWLRPEVSRSAKAWYKSAQQQMRLFYDIMGLKSVHHRKTGKLTADDAALIEIKLRYPELSRLVDTIAELRSLGVFQNNFLSAAIDPDDRMRCSFNPAGPETMRWSSSENAFGRGTNLQNIPKGIVRKGR